LTIPLLEISGSPADSPSASRPPRPATAGGTLFVDWLDFGGVSVDSSDAERVAAVELEASRRDPYRRLSRVFHLLGRHR
jgi:hypothetical protein